MLQNPAPRNIDILWPGNRCNFNCEGCYASSAPNLTGITDKGEKSLIEKIVQEYSDSSWFFIYPKEVTTSMDLVPLMGAAGQKLVLTNGALLNRGNRLERLREAGIETLKVTYFSTYEEQARWQSIDEATYQRIGKNIVLAKDAGFNVFINNVLWKENVEQLPALVAKAEDMGVDRIKLIRFRNPKPSGEYLTAREMPGLVEMLEDIKAKRRLPEGVLNENGEPFRGPRLQFSATFGGPDLVGLSEARLKAKMPPKEGEWVKGPYLCPAINQNYWAISPREGSVSWCYFIAGMVEARIGDVDIKTGNVTINRSVDMRPTTLKKNLQGMCSQRACEEYQGNCLGGCRSTALTAAKWQGNPDPLYAGMDICLSRAKSEVLGLPWRGEAAPKQVLLPVRG